jgi:hypothetical protein
MTSVELNELRLPEMCGFLKGGSPQRRIVSTLFAVVTSKSPARRMPVMDRMMHAPQAAGFADAVARVSVQHLLGYGWQLGSSPCTTNGFAMNITTKRSPRRLGKRST